LLMSDDPVSATPPVPMTPSNIADQTSYDMSVYSASEWTDTSTYYGNNAATWAASEYSDAASVSNYDISAWAASEYSW
jgi:hypothetical protein